MVGKEKFNVLTMIRCNYKIIDDDQKYFIIPASPATGALYITENNKGFISGHVRARGRENGSYPYNYLEMIDRLFGEQDNTIEVCSGMIKKYNSCGDGRPRPFAVDINPKTNPDLVDDGQILSSIPNNMFDRCRCDPPYNAQTARKMYGTDLPSTIKLLNAATRVCKVGSLIFLLLGPKNYQCHPKGVGRIGCIPITVVPNNELRVLNIYCKYADTFRSTHAPGSLILGSGMKKYSHHTQTRLDPFTFSTE